MVWTAPRVISNRGRRWDYAMKLNHSFHLLITVIMALTISGPAQASDSPWPTFRQDLRHQGRTLFTGPAAPAVKWVFSANDGVVSSPAIGDDGTIYVGAGWNSEGAVDSSLYAINPDGSLKWRFTTKAGVFSSPAIGPDGTIYFGSLDTYLYALEDSLTYGKLKWATSLGAMVYSSPVIVADGTVYVGDLNFYIYAVNPDGSVKWKYRTGWCVFSSPAIGPDGVVYVGSKDENLYALEDSVTYGKLRWKYATGKFYDGHFVDSSPAVGSDGTIYVGTDPYGGGGKDQSPVDRVFFAVNPDGSLKWAFDMEDGAESSPAIGADGTVYVGSFDGNLYAIRDLGTSGVLEWLFHTRGWIDGSPTVDGCGTIYVGSRDSTLYAINPDGTLRWSFPTGGGIECSPTIDENGILYIGSFDGKLYALGSGGPDVGVVSIDLPSEVQTDSLYVPKVSVRNYRSGPQSFDVSCLIENAGHFVYGDTLSVSQLAETTSVMGTFAPWIVGPDTGIAYSVIVTALLGSDDNRYNDTLTTQTRTVAHWAGVPKEEMQTQFSLGQCFPNPFNAKTTIHFSVKQRTRVSLKIYNVAGQLVRTLLNEELFPGTYTNVVWDGLDNSGNPIGSGVYLYNLDTPCCSETKKMVLLR